MGGGSCDAGAGDGEDVRECGRVAGVGWGAEEGCDECEEGGEEEDGELCTMEHGGVERARRGIRSRV